MTSTEPKLTRAALDALAWTHVTGWTRPNIHPQTFNLVHRMVDLQRTPGRCWNVKPEHVELAESQPLTRAVRKLEAEGWKVKPIDERPRRRRSRYVTMRKPGSDRVLDAAVYVDGYTVADEDR